MNWLYWADTLKKVWLEQSSLWFETTILFKLDEIRFRCNVHFQQWQLVKNINLSIDLINIIAIHMLNNKLDCFNQFVSTECLNKFPAQISILYMVIFRHYCVFWPHLEVYWYQLGFHAGDLGLTPQYSCKLVTPVTLNIQRWDNTCLQLQAPFSNNVKQNRT